MANASVTLKQERIDEVVLRANGDGQDITGPDHSGFDQFAEALLEDATADELAAYDGETWYHIALSFWRFAGNRPPRTTKLRVINPVPDRDGWSTSHSVLQIVCDDMQFLVDSVLGQLTDLNLRLYSVIHPVVQVGRDNAGNRIDIGPHDTDTSRRLIRESMIHIEFEHNADPKFLEMIRNRIENVLKRVALVVADFDAMRERLQEAAKGLTDNPPAIDLEELDESNAFLTWLHQNHFVFLGSRIYRFEGEPETGNLIPLDESGLGLLRDPKIRVLRRGRQLVNLTPEVREFLMLPAPIIITKANVRSDVHRRVHMDYVGVKLFDALGKLAGEYRFVGLFTADAYNLSPSDIPLLSRKIARVIERSGFPSTTYNAKALQNILDTFPRDELFQISEDELLRYGLSILDLQERPRTRILLRHDRYDRYVSALVYVPRDRYDSRVRERIADILTTEFDGHISAYYPHFNDTPLARIHFIIGLNPDKAPHWPDPDELENKIIEVARSWTDDLAVALDRFHGEAGSQPLFARYRNAFSAGYKAAASAMEAVHDIEKLEPLGPSPAVTIRSFHGPGDPDYAIRFKLFRADEPVPLSDVLPILENIGLRVIQEASYPLDRGDALFWIHDFYMEHPRRQPLSSPSVGKKIEEAFAAVWQGRAENDGFNRLTIGQELSWRNVALLRSLAHYRQQTGRTLSVSYMQDTLVRHPAVTQLLVDLFYVRFDPALSLEKEQRLSRAEEIRLQILEALNEVDSLDEDRIMRQFLDLIMALLRTNFFQTDEAGTRKAYLSFKISSRDIADLPLPKPLTEIFVYSTRFEAVHLRWSPVARGGLRWSDRREDFRTEILGLAKAQQVKNAIIVPAGAKGGFVPKQLPSNGSRQDILDEGVICYRMFIAGLLDLTDNIKNGKVVGPDHLIAYDDDDPYLVVAADKGTATFSDIANEIAARYDFWLGDAFASGGSQGYDHKGMGITARGAWEATKRHFRELGVDIQTQDFTVIGVGDMSGDVFGNGMLLSKHIKLVAAFDHRDIFFDPDPDPDVGWQERARLFSLPRSSWADYDRGRISPGGGVFSRSLKAIDLTPAMQSVLGIDDDRLTPDQLIRQILRAPVDLLWFGGIGTCVKSGNERDGDVGDKSNDAIRINAEQLQVKVIGEGANLAITQAGRIVYAAAGGRINTDAIDNVGGVDCSDHEVNIKILLDSLVSKGTLSIDQRNDLLEAMTEDVSALVLKNCYDQTLALSIAESSAVDDLNSHKRFMQELERDERLNRQVENLPDDEGLNELGIQGRGLVRPELAIVMAYAKTKLFDELVASDVPAENYLRRRLIDYFPDILGDRYQGFIEQHQLRHEIVASVLANECIDYGGITFINRIADNTGATPALIVRAFIASDGIFGLKDLRYRINELDNRIAAKTQIELHLRLLPVLSRQILWLLRHGVVVKDGTPSLAIAKTIDNYRPLVETVRECIENCLPAGLCARIDGQASLLEQTGVDQRLARDIAIVSAMASAGDIIDVARLSDRSIAVATEIYFELGEMLGLDQLRDDAGQMRPAEHWARLAIQRVLDDLYQQQRALTLSVLGRTAAQDNGGDAIAAWMSQHRADVDRTMTILAEMEVGGGLTVAKLSLAGSQIRELAAIAANRDAR